MRAGHPLRSVREATSKTRNKRILLGKRGHGYRAAPYIPREATAAYELARAAGFSSVNLDLMWGLPGQKRRDWLRNLTEAVSLEPDHLSCYGLTPEEGTRLSAACDAGEITLPDEKEQAVMYVDGADYLESRGYLQYEISNFARMGFACRHNLGYWESRDYLGLGPAATSTLHGARWTNPADLGKWIQAVRAQSIGREKEALTPKIRVMETVMLRLRTTGGLRIKAYHDLTGRDFLRDNKSLITMLHDQGLLRIRGGYLRLTRTGMLVSDSILAHLFEIMDAQLTEEPPLSADN
ncbi:hypothetical protein FACS1894168_2550 [Deltaproteobacteria bacterium]|nr:hypothetical protein FACS1894168_2550 [Deltaproteobacteria bacterium]